MEARIEALGDGERKWIESHRRIVRSFVGSYARIEPTGEPPALQDLDAARSALLPQWERHDPNHIINAVGIAIGEHLIASLDLRWVVATDDYGTELAVHGEPGNVIVYPANHVAKRFESRTAGFVAPLVSPRVEDIRRVRAEEAT